jgi:L-rhamnose isomerase/sugar isomerase
MNFADPRDANYIASANEPHASALAADYTALGVQLQRRGISIDEITRKVADFRVAITPPHWGWPSTR